LKNGFTEIYVNINKQTNKEINQKETDKVNSLEQPKLFDIVKLFFVMMQLKMGTVLLILLLKFILLHLTLLKLNYLKAISIMCIFKELLK
jgi:hypothetical protein